MISALSAEIILKTLCPLCLERTQSERAVRSVRSYVLELALLLICFPNFLFVCCYSL
jgi:hypothetical protein